ncbi:T9SS type A sorting domain-containing protein [Flavobacteriaceae bacterium Ap0902]|nr:T9SS type A sorting domain-containing protein [Flavobacteriaceae bacterium Ap0902]
MKKYTTILFVILASLIFASNAAPTSELVSYEYGINPTIDTEKVIITPNPAKENTMVKIIDDEAQIAQISIYSLLGNQIFARNYTGNENSIMLNVQAFKKGKYLIKVIFKDGSSEVKALIKQ